MNTLALFGFAVGLVLVSLANAAARDMQSRLEGAGSRQGPYSSPKILVAMTREYCEVAREKNWSLWPVVVMWTFSVIGIALFLLSAVVLV